MRPAFNPNRLVLLDLHGEHQQLTVQKCVPLKTALQQQYLLPDTPVLYTSRHGQTLVFQTQHFSLYNVMHSPAGDAPWMATFCAVCNAGMSFSPLVNGKRHDFYGAGFYDAMTLLADKQTGSYWDHLTGECIAGPLQGARLQQLANLTHANAAAVLRAHPDALLMVTELDAARAALVELAESLRTLPQPAWLPQLIQSLDTATEDTRLPRLEMGLGVWTTHTARFYPFTTIHALDNRLFDTVDGRTLLVYIDPDTGTPTAMFVDAQSVAWRGDTLVLDQQQTIHNGGLYAQGQAQPAQRPLQLFQRWYGFAITFPGCDIYTSARAGEPVRLLHHNR
jgi:hypothetical protein